MRSESGGVETRGDCDFKSLGLIHRLHRSTHTTTMDVDSNMDSGLQPPFIEQPTLSHVRTGAPHDGRKML